ncbi:Ubiquitin-conjugating enzyme E2 E1 [Heterocephalus glaber]|uniref:Ubiquitin-conjugating enzyme E2 E1 n=1 Tax=Heterocephalus glaber TaxID=10181 RepID=G5BFP7_HETGA|nr:Ubiquitin-conjugating enzyme E2 E1 [Heterocephalus glaber]
MSDDDSRASTSSSSSSSSNQQTEKETNTPKKKESKVSMSKNSKLLSTSAKRIQKELADITLDPPPNCSALTHRTSVVFPIPQTAACESDIGQTGSGPESVHTAHLLYAFFVLDAGITQNEEDKAFK